MEKKKNKELTTEDVWKLVENHPKIEMFDTHWNRVKIKLKDDKNLYIVTDNNIWEFADHLGIDLTGDN